jgi:hypothetical protein
VSTEKANGELVPFEQFDAPLVKDPAAMDFLVAAMSGLNPTPFDLPSISVPGGGSEAPTWALPTDGRPKAVDHLDVLFLTMTKQRAWWRQPYGSGEASPPDCKSDDYNIGHGNNTMDPKADPGEHKCAECPWSKFGSARGQGAKGKDCGEKFRAYFLPPGARIPHRLDIPPTSHAAFKSYLYSLVNGGKLFSDVVTRIGLKKGSNAFGTSEMTFERVSDIPEEMKAQVKEIGRIVLTLIVTA